MFLKTTLTLSPTLAWIIGPKEKANVLSTNWSLRRYTINHVLFTICSTISGFYCTNNIFSSELQKLYGKIWICTVCVSGLFNILTHNAEMLHVSGSFDLFGKLVTGELSVDDLLVTRAYESTLLVQKDGGRTAARESPTHFDLLKQLQFHYNKFSLLYKRQPKKTRFASIAI